MYLGPKPTPRNQWESLRDITGACIIADKPKHLLNYSVNLTPNMGHISVQIARALNRPTRFANYKENKQSMVGKEFVYRELSAYRKHEVWRHTQEGRDFRLRKEIKRQQERKSQKVI